jgi:hypothetical protein
MNMTVILVGMMAWTAVSIVVGVGVGGAMRYCGRRDGLVPVASGEMLRKTA